MPHHEPTIAGILRLLAAEYDGPVAERQVLDQVLQQRPSSAKNPYATIRERLRWDGLTLGWLRLSRRELVPLRVALQGLRFRCLPRARDLLVGQLPLVCLQPFAGLRSSAVRLIDGEGRAYPLIDLSADDGLSELDWHLPGFDLSAWYARHSFAAGDSLIVTVVSAEPLTLQLAYEPAVAFQREQVAEQDAELLAAMVAHVVRSQTALIPCDDLVLPIFARAAWRASYPGTPWQQLVVESSRLQLVDDIFVTNHRHAAFRMATSDQVFSADEESVSGVAYHSAEIWDEIDSLQGEIRRSRQQDAEAGLWSGQIQRSSAALSLFDRYGEERHSPSLFEDLEQLAAEMELAEENEWDIDGLDDDDDLFADLPPLEPQDRQLSFQEAHERMLALLPNEAVERLQNARPEEAEVIVASHLNSLLARDLSLFPRIDLSPRAELGAISSPLTDGGDRVWQSDDEWEEDDDWGEDLESDLEERFEVASGIYQHSSDLMNQFHDYLRETGKSASTARRRAQQLAVYAEFLASYYNRTLAEGDYATLDECLFYYYPRRVLNTSPRQVREICVSLKQFYSFLKLRGDVADERFAEAHWRRRDQAARVIEIFDRIAADAPDYDALYARLFEPYVG
jgi:hypothetical protein